MEYQSVLLIQLYGLKQPPDAEPLSIEVLAGALLENFPNIQVKLCIVDVRDFESGWSEVRKVIQTLTPLVIGVSIPQSTFSLAMDLLKMLKTCNQRATIVLGHALPTYSPERFLREYPEVIVVQGWGEDSLVGIIERITYQNYDFFSIPNLVYYRDGTLIKTVVRWPKKIYSPYRLSIQHYFPRIEASRGCHHNICTFCTRPPAHTEQKQTWVRKPVKQVIEELNATADAEKYSFTFADEDFVGNDIEGALEIARGIQKLPGLHFTLSVRADNIINKNDTREKAERRRLLFNTLKDAGLYHIFIGVEALSTSQLKRYGKNIQVSEILAALAFLNDQKIMYELGLILFDPLLTISELEENIKQIERNHLDVYIGQIFNPLRPQPDCSYLKLLAAKNIHGEYDPDSMQYRIPFVSTEIANIFSIGRSWLNKFDNLYLLARGMRNNYFEKEYIDFIHQIRRLLFAFLKDLVVTTTVGTSQETENIISSYDLMRNNSIKILSEFITEKGKISVLDYTELILLEKSRALVT